MGSAHESRQGQVFLALVQQVQKYLFSLAFPYWDASDAEQSTREWREWSPETMYSKNNFNHPARTPGDLPKGESLPPKNIWFDQHSVIPMTQTVHLEGLFS